MKKYRLINNRENRLELNGGFIQLRGRLLLCCEYYSDKTLKNILELKVEPKRHIVFMEKRKDRLIYYCIYR